MPKFKGQKTIAILVIMLLCCFAFGGVASAGSADNDLSPNVVKASHTYGYDIEFDVDDVDAIVLGDTDLVVQFPAVDGGEQFDLSPADGHAVEIGVGVSRDGYQYMQIIPTIDNTAHTATFRIQKQNLPMDGNVNSIKIEGLKVTNTCAEGTYTIRVSDDAFGSKLFGLRVVETVGSITLTEPVEGNCFARRHHDYRFG